MLFRWSPFDEKNDSETEAKAGKCDDAMLDLLKKLEGLIKNLDPANKEQKAEIDAAFKELWQKNFERIATKVTHDIDYIEKSNLDKDDNYWQKSWPEANDIQAIENLQDLEKKVGVLIGQQSYIALTYDFEENAANLDGNVTFEKASTLCAKATNNRQSLQQGLAAVQSFNDRLASLFKTEAKPAHGWRTPMKHKTNERETTKTNLLGEIRMFRTEIENAKTVRERVQNMKSQPKNTI